MPHAAILTRRMTVVNYYVIVRRHMTSTEMPYSGRTPGRKRTGDIVMRKLPAPIPGAVRSYVSRGRLFVLSLLNLHRLRSLTPSWRLLHRPSGAEAELWSYTTAVDLIRRIQSPPESETDRWVVLPRPEPFAGQVLFDRASGRWFGRDRETPVRPEELEAMSQAMPITEFRTRRSEPDAPGIAS